MALSALEEAFRLLHWTNKFKTEPPLSGGKDEISRCRYGVNEVSKFVNKWGDLTDDKKSIYRQVYLHGEGSQQTLTVVERAKKKVSKHGT